jgi:hypothetical protein
VPLGSLWERLLLMLTQATVLGQLASRTFLAGAGSGWARGYLFGGGVLGGRVCAPP